MRSWITLFETVSFENVPIVTFSNDHLVYHTTGHLVADKIRKDGFKTGNELNVAERRSAIFFSDLDVNPSLYARNEQGSVNDGQESDTIAVNIKGLRLLNMTYKHDGKFPNHTLYRSAVVHGKLENIPAFVEGQIDGTISFLNDGRIFEVCLPKDIANRLLKSS